jgi:BTB/POZ domain
MTSSIMLKATNGLAQLMSGKYSDLNLVCQGTEFKVHKVIVCTQSPVIKAACDGEFQVQN